MISLERRLCDVFNKFHEGLSVVRAYTEPLEDMEVTKLVEQMEFGLLGPMRKLRLKLDIPYNWNETPDKE